MGYGPRMGVRQQDLSPVDPQRLKQLRLRARLSQMHLAKLSGISNATISRMEKRQQVPSHETVEALVRAMSAYADWNYSEVLEVALGRRKTWQAGFAHNGSYGKTWLKLDE